LTRAHTPTTLTGALEILADSAGGIVPVAGCTDLMVADMVTGRAHAQVLDLLRIPELQGIREDAGYLDIGAACSFSTIREDPCVGRHAAILVQAAASVGGWQIQNRATLGGNIANASPAGDSLPVLLALDAHYVVASAQGTRTVAAEDMHVGYRKTALKPGELIVRARIPINLPSSVDRATTQIFRKVGTRAAQAISKVVLAFSGRREGKGLLDVRIAAGSVAPVPVRLRQAEAAALGGEMTRQRARLVADVARGEVTPISDVRSTAEYRSHVLGRIVYRALLEASRDA